jgi:hypothetical protein
MTFENVFFRLKTGALILLCLFAFGCGKNVSVTGTVTYSDTGEPVKFGMVVFTGEKEIGRGAIKDGKYSVGLINDRDGIPPGKYTVSSDEFPAPNYNMVDMFGNRSPSSSQNQEVYYTKEPKTIEVKKSMTYDFTVERGVRPK